jgi:Tol biopolymer transport system component
MSLRTLLAAASALVLAAAFGPGASAREDGAPAKVSAIPADAAVIFSSTRDGEKDRFGLPAKELYVASLDGKATRITWSRYNANHFTVSPDRKKIAVNRYSLGDTNADGEYFPLHDKKQLWIVDVEKRTERVIIPDIDAGYGGLAWGPDSQWVYFSSPTGKQVMDLRRVNIDTQEVQVLTGGLNALLGIKDDKRKFVSDIDVSPDGQWLVFLYTGPDMIESGKPKTRIAVMKTDGSEARIVTNGGDLPAGKRGVWSTGDFDPDFGPDGTTITFARMTDTGWVTKTLSTWAVYTINRDGTGEKRITPDLADTAFFIPAWGQDGRLIYTEASARVGLTPTIYDPRTGETTRVSAGDGSHVQWIPTGH